MHSQHSTDIRHLDSIDRSALPADGGHNFNRLIFSQNPYLLQHAANPVDWYPWGDEAFALAKEESKPVFLSIGYSTCHWCHVMAHESFEDETVARVLKDSFIAIKVDREERPDVDGFYMNACQMMTGSGGWPLTLVLTPDKKPFFAATYLPRTPRQGMHGLIDLLERIADLWENRWEEIRETGRQVTDALLKMESNRRTLEEPNDRLLRKALKDYRDSFDTRAAGFGKAPKFPSPHNLSLLFRLGQRFAAPDASRMACATLSAIRSGGIYDQFGYGLHRYAVDGDWQVPHFEKMLYDQALFIHAALDAWQVTGEEEFAEMARSTIDYLLRDLRDPQGGFYCGEDADSEGAEGTFYLWTPDQVSELFDEETAALVCECYGITAAGNFEGRSIPHRVKPLDELAAEHDQVPEFLAEALEEARQVLLEHRAKRIRPHRDDKVLSGWNGLTVAALARAGAVLGEDSWKAAAADAMTFMLGGMVDPEDRLLRSWRQGVAGINAFAEDYAFLVWGLLELYQATFETCHLTTALQWAARTMELFGDETGEFWDTADDSEQIIGRGRSLMDGALPAPGSVMANNLLRLSDLTGDETWENHALALLRSRLGQALEHPTAFAQLLIGLDYSLGPRMQLAICTTGNKAQGESFREETARRFLPRLITALAAGDDDNIRQTTRVFDGRTAGDGRAAAYLCSDHTCQAPVAAPVELGRQLDDLLRRNVTPV